MSIRPDPGPVVVRLAGQLGNQLFELAAGRTLADRLGAPLRFEPAKSGVVLDRCVGDVYRQATATDLLRCGVSAVPYTARVALTARRSRDRARERLGAVPRYLEPADDLGYDESFEQLVAPCYLRGYFQHPGYFEPSLDDVCALVIDHLGIGRRREDGHRPVVGVHFRRGDFVGLGWALGLDYYDRALAALAERVPRFDVRVFSDDRMLADLIEEHLTRKGQTPARSGGSGAAGDPIVGGLVDMARCDHLVMANSTYSWWAATIGDRLGSPGERVVVCPTVWDPRREPHHLARPGWVPVDSAGSF